MVKIVFWGGLSKAMLYGLGIGSLCGLHCWWIIWNGSGRKISFFKRRALFESVFGELPSRRPSQLSILALFTMLLVSLLIPILEDTEIEIPAVAFWLGAFVWQGLRFLKGSWTV
ncbi:MAG TPA: hypothetical protein ENK02_14860 [Planctomycetes bacterium]|nr:hypothetical protein [Planctomycetota bacterium]